MKKYTDKQLADYLLEMRQRDGRSSFWRAFEKHKGQAILFFTIIAVFLVLGIFARIWAFPGFVFGYAVGILSRDRAYRKQLRSVWPFYLKTFDWLKIEKIARGEATD